ncbi:MAG TPA: hypothetical protein VNI77_04165, partial [Nitrososphaera sp.]|nr:hypothetical protein [Nitrososphaera sp.]
GTLDLRQVYARPEIDELSIVLSEGGALENLFSSPIQSTEIPERWLPQIGFFIRAQSPTDIRVVEEAVNRSRAVIHCKLNPPEALSEPKIYAEHLSQATKLVQRLVKHAFRRAIRSLDKELRERLSAVENYQLEVFAFSEGSFTLHMQSAMPADLVGYAEITKALEVIDRVTSLAGAPGSTVEEVSQLGGHFATAYKDLLKFITETETHLEYEWASPDRARSVKHAISSAQAKPLYDALVERSELEAEPVTLIGKLTKVDEKLRTWRLVAEADAKEYNGISDIDLAGLVIETQRYEFICEERLEEERGTGKEFTKLHLVSFRPIT